MFSYSEVSVSFVFLSEIHYSFTNSNTLIVFTCSSLPWSKRMEDLRAIKYESLKDKCVCT